MMPRGHVEVNYCTVDLGRECLFLSGRVRRKRQGGLEEGEKLLGSV
jgi:hypothetical protein